MIRLAVRVRRAQAELVLAELLELAPAGVEELDVGSEAVEYAVYGSPGELPALGDLEAAVGDALVQVSTTEIPDGWQERWKLFHRPILIEAPAALAGAGAACGQLKSSRPELCLITSGIGRRRNVAVTATMLRRHYAVLVVIAVAVWAGLRLLVSRAGDGQKL